MDPGDRPPYGLRAAVDPLRARAALLARATLRQLTCAGSVLVAQPRWLGCKQEVLALAVVASWHVPRTQHTDVGRSHGYRNREVVQRRQGLRLRNAGRAR